MNSNHHGPHPCALHRPPAFPSGGRRPRRALGPTLTSDTCACAGPLLRAGRPGYGRHRHALLVALDNLLGQRHLGGGAWGGGRQRQAGSTGCAVRGVSGEWDVRVLAATSSLMYIDVLHPWPAAPGRGMGPRQAVQARYGIKEGLGRVQQPCHAAICVCTCVHACMRVRERMLVCIVCGVCIKPAIRVGEQPTAATTENPRLIDVDADLGLHPNQSPALDQSPGGPARGC